MHIKILTYGGFQVNEMDLPAKIINEIKALPRMKISSILLLNSSFLPSVS